MTSRLDWPSFKCPKQATVCFFNVAHELDSRDPVIQWLYNIPKHDRSDYGLEVKLGKRPQPLLPLSLLPLLETHCLANPYRCAMGGDRNIYIDISVSGEVFELHLFTPMITFN